MKRNQPEKQLNLFGERLPIRPRSPDDVFQKATAEDLVEIRESDLYERKPVGIHSNELGEYISMWANTKPNGGVMIIGMSNSGELIGCISAGEKRTNELKKVGHNFCPDAKMECREVEFTHSNGHKDYVLLIRIWHNSHKVIRHVNGKAYWRIADEKRDIPFEIVSQLESDFGQTPFEQELCHLRYPDDFDSNALSSWAERVKDAKKWLPETTTEQVLTNLHLGRLEGDPRSFFPAMGCALLFANDPVGLIPGCRVHCLRYPGEHEGTGQEYAPLKDEFFEGTVPNVIAQTAQWLDSQLRTFTRFGKDGKFHTSQEYPREAWYEMIVNACVHRSYGLRNSHISVKMFSDHLVVESPGGFMPNISPENIYDTPPNPRNPFLYHAMWYLEFVRCNNEGAKRIRDFMAKANLPPPEFSERSKNYSFVRVVLLNDIKKRKLWSDEDSMKVIGAQVFEQLSEVERQIINYVIEYGQINISDTQRLTQFSWPKSRQVLGSLVDRNILSHIKNVKPGKDRNPTAHFVLKRSSTPS